MPHQESNKAHQIYFLITLEIEINFKQQFLTAELTRTTNNSP